MHPHRHCAHKTLLEIPRSTIGAKVPRTKFTHADLNGCCNQFDKEILIPFLRGIAIPAIVARKIAQRYIMADPSNLH